MGEDNVFNINCSNSSNLLFNTKLYRKSLGLIIKDWTLLVDDTPNGEPETVIVRVPSVKLSEGFKITKG